MIRYLFIITLVFIFKSSNLYAQFFNLELPQIGSCDNKISMPSPDASSQAVYSEINLSNHLLEPIRTKIPRYKSFRLGEIFKDNEKGKPAPEIKIVADFNNDGFDDLMIENYENNSPPTIYLSNGDGSFKPQDGMPKSAGRRHIRVASAVDINNDGWVDIAGFTTGDPYSHWVNNGFEGKKSDVPRGEIDLLLINQKGNGFKEVKIPEIRKNDWNHGGTVGDINKDGKIDILPLSEGEKERTEPLINNGNNIFNFSGYEYSKEISYYLSGDVEVADLNSDGYLDIVVAVKDINTPNKINREIGSVHIIYGDGDFNFSDNKKIRIGTHWISESERKEANKKLSNFIPNEKGLSKELDFGPSNIEIIDIDNDGYQDILVGYFLSPYMWMTSGFTLLKNHGDCFLDETEKFFPNQNTNRHFEPEQVSAYTHNFFHGDLNGDGFKDLVLQTDGAGRWSSGPHKYHPYIFLNDGDNVYLPPLKETIPIDKYQTSNTDFFSLGDINGDGSMDLITLQNDNKPGANEIVAFIQLTPSMKQKIKKEELAKEKENLRRIKETKIILKKSINNVENNLLKLNYENEFSPLRFQQNSELVFHKAEEQDIVKASIDGKILINDLSLKDFLDAPSKILNSLEKLDTLAAIIKTKEFEAVGIKLTPELEKILNETLINARKKCGKIAKPLSWTIFILSSKDKRTINLQKCYVEKFKEASPEIWLTYQILALSAPSISKQIFPDNERLIFEKREKEQKSSEAEALKISQKENRARLKANALRIKKEKEEAKIIKKNKILEYQNKFESILNQVENDLLNDGFVKRYNQILFTENSSKISKTISGDELAKSDIDGKLFFDDFPLEEILENEVSYKSIKKLSTMVAHIKNENFEAFGIRMTTEMQNLLIKASDEARNMCGRIAKPSEWLIFIISNNGNKILDIQKCHANIFKSHSKDVWNSYKTLGLAANSIINYLKN